jgi:hypothetical protein
MPVVKLWRCERCAVELVADEHSHALDIGWRVVIGLAPDDSGDPWTFCEDCSAEMATAVKTHPKLRLGNAFGAMAE